MPKEFSINSSSSEESVDYFGTRDNRGRKFNSERSIFAKDAEHPSPYDIKIKKECEAQELSFYNIME